MAIPGSRLKAADLNSSTKRKIEMLSPWISGLPAGAVVPETCEREP